MKNNASFIKGFVKGLSAPFEAFAPTTENRGLSALKVYKPIQRRSPSNDIANIRSDFQTAMGVINAEVSRSQ